MKRKSKSVESLIDNMKGLSVNLSPIDSVINDMKIIKINPQDPWEILQENYSKLKYVSTFSLTSYTQKLSEFMESIDKHTVQYLREIDFYDPGSDYRIESYVIRELLENSLNQHDYVKKIEIILKAYEILILVVEQIRNQRYTEIVDMDFVQLFKKQCV